MSEYQKIAVLDISPDSATMLLVNSDSSGNIEIINEFGAGTQLIDSISEYNLLPKTAIQKTINICDELVKIANKEKVDKIIAVATSAIRSAINKTELLGGCHTKFNIFPHLLNETEEYNYIFKGAVLGYIGTQRPIIVIEVGEDTTEIIYGTKEIMVDYFSLKLGTIHLAHSFCLKGSFVRKVCTPLRAHIRKTSEKAITAIKSWLNGRKSLILCTGDCATTFAGLISDNGQTNRASIDNTLSNVRTARNLARKMGKMSVDARKTMLGTEHEKAAYEHIGIYTMAKLVKSLGEKEFRITTNDMKTGLIKSYIEKNRHSV